MNDSPTLHVFSHEGVLYRMIENDMGQRWLESEFGEREVILGPGLDGLRSTLDILAERVEFDEDRKD